MTTGTIIAIVVAALIILALVAFFLPRTRARAKLRARERELEQRRGRVADEHRAEADARQRQATEAEQRARIAEREARAERAEAELHQERAGVHERGMADHELIDDSEREKFAGTSAMRPGTRDDDDRQSTTTGRQDADTPTGAATGGALDADTGDYERGRRDEAAAREGRFTRAPATERDDVRSSR